MAKRRRSRRRVARARSVARKVAPRRRSRSVSAKKVTLKAIGNSVVQGAGYGVVRSAMDQYVIPRVAPSIQQIPLIGQFADEATAIAGLWVGSKVFKGKMANDLIQKGLAVEGFKIGQGLVGSFTNGGLFQSSMASSNNSTAVSGKVLI